jgi:hypothetical protein
MHTVYWSGIFEKRQFGISGHRRQSNIKMGLWKIGCDVEDSTELTWVGCGGPGLVITVTALKPIQGRKYLGYIGKY